MSEEEVLDIVLSDPFAHVTFTGGDPFYQAEGFARLARMIKERSNKNIWAYTGFLFEQLLDSPLLAEIDGLVDGPFIMAQRDTELVFRGSANQRIIDVPSSLKAGHVVEYQLDLGV